MALTELVGAVESMRDAVALFDGEDRLVHCNGAYRRLLAPLSPDAFVGQSYLDLLQAWVPKLRFSCDEARAAFVRERLSRRGELEVSFDTHTLDGRCLRGLDRRTSLGGTVSTVSDVTNDHVLVEELRWARATADTASASKSEFLSSMSHEIRTPLNAILGFAQLLERDKKQPLHEKHREHVSQILRAGEHLLRLIDDVLDLSRIEAGLLSISKEPIDVIEVLEEVRSTLEPSAAGRVAIEVGAATNDVPMIAADRIRFAQIVMNFGSNGVKYNRAGGRVTLFVSESAADRIRVTVSDTGLGIPSDQQQRLFQPFQRAGQEAGGIEGTGIGLSITKRLAELMGGGVGFRSIYGEGSDFWVEMPVHGSHKRSITPPALRLNAPIRTLPR